MSRKHCMIRRQLGVGLAAALFLLLVLAALITFLLTTSGLQHSSAALDVQGSRAFQAARAGIDWGVYRALQDDSCAASASFALAGGLSDFTVTVTCVDTPYTEIDSTVKHVYSITATACNTPAAGACPGTTGPFYVERQLQALMDKPG
jgi:MSHA biogenesis protein MshP